MSLTNILILISISLGICALSRFERTRRWRGIMLLIISVVVIFWLQPTLPIRGLDFWLPCATLALAGLGWVLTSLPGELNRRETTATILIVTGTVLLITLTRYLGSTGILTASRPPQTVTVLLVTLVSLVLLLALSRMSGRFKFSLSLGIIGILLLFIVLKLPSLTFAVSGLLRGLTGQSREMASALDIRWLGFSYIAFRLIHTLRDRQAGRLPSMTLREYLVYILFFPAVSAGPIDRSERFIKDLRAEFSPGALEVGTGITRVVVGMFKKFVVADALALISLNATNAAQVDAAGWLWLLLLAYSLQIYLDFSGYTDIALGMAVLMGIRLPENFRAPYLKPNLTRFWDNWHITLTQWFRAYFFFPLTRFLRTRTKWLPVWLVILVTQLSTMILIGLWHGITLNFVLWGAWHGAGLFVQNRWSGWTQRYTARLQTRPVLNRTVTVFSTLLTSVYVTLGWVWFTIPDASLSLHVLGRLFGLGGGL
jgi:D-alanyl-lipoteichoic acid acyltransferase DltB (MBOAT superfamily)